MPVGARQGWGLGNIRFDSHQHQQQRTCHLHWSNLCGSYNYQQQCDPWKAVYFCDSDLQVVYSPWRWVLRSLVTRDKSLYSRLRLKPPPDGQNVKSPAGREYDNNCLRFMSTPSATCSQCGASAAGGRIFCEKCGAALRTPVPLVASDFPDTAPMESNESAFGDFGSRDMFLCLLVAISVFIVVAYFAGLGRGRAAGLCAGAGFLVVRIRWKSTERSTCHCRRVGICFVG